MLLVIGVVGAYLGTRSAPIGRVSAGAGTLRDQLGIVARARDFRLLLGTFLVQALAIGSMLAGVAYVSRWVLTDKAAATINRQMCLNDVRRARPSSRAEIARETELQRSNSISDYKMKNRGTCRGSW